jgi:xylulose-5-phosphate/fructose-6-phosphate phosphoketolase
MTTTPSDELTASTLSSEESSALHAWWRAANYLSAGQIYLLDNPLLTEPLKPEHIKPRLLGHWGTTPGLNFVYAHANRAIRERDLNAMYVIGPGHGGPAIVANAWLEGTWTETYPAVGRDSEGMRRLFRQFSFPGGIPSHVAPEVPGSIHEGGELGYSLAHSYGAAFDNPDLVVFCVVGDGEAETGPLAASWHSNKFLDPVHDGAVLPILHLNGHKIANPTVLARIPEEELLALLRGYGHEPYLVTVTTDTDPADAHEAMASVLDTALDDIAQIQQRHRQEQFRSDDVASDEADRNDRAQAGGSHDHPRWPCIVLRSPKGWTGPVEVDGHPVEGTHRAHQVPLSGTRTDDEHRRQLEDWMKSYRPEELFDENGTPRDDVLAPAPAGPRRMSANPSSNGGLVLRDLALPDFTDYAVQVDSPATEPTRAGPMSVLGPWLRDVIAANPDSFRLFGPDETASNRLSAVWETTGTAWQGRDSPDDAHLTPDGRVMEVLSEHLCQGWLEGYLLTGRHGVLNCYEAFIHIISSMFNQHAKWLKVTHQLDWRRPLPSLNYLLASHVWQQDHNGFSHQDPGFIDHVVNKKSGIVRVYLPPDANTLLSTMYHCLNSKHLVNVVVAGKQPSLQYLSMEQAITHCTRGLGIWPWASTDVDGELPDVVLACAGDVPTGEALAAADMLRASIPGLKLRFLNVVDLMRLEHADGHPHGLPDEQFDALFTKDRPVIFAYHGYPWLIHRLVHRRTNSGNFSVRGYLEEGATTTPFDMVMANDLDRFSLAIDVIDKVPKLGASYAGLRQQLVDARIAAHQYTRDHGEDDPAITNWTWA